MGEECPRAEVPFSVVCIRGHVTATWLITGDITLITWLTWCLPSVFPNKITAFPLHTLLSGSQSLSPAHPQGEGVQVPPPGVGSIYMYYLEFFSREDFPFSLIYCFVESFITEKTFFLKNGKITARLYVGGNDPIENKVSRVL